MSTENDLSDMEVHGDIRVRTRRVSDANKCKSEKSVNWYKLLTVDYVLQFVCTLSWVYFFLSLALICWLIWFGILGWLVIRLPGIYSTYKALQNQSKPSILAQLNFYLYVFRYFTVFIVVLIYHIHWALDRRSEERGSHPRVWVRNLAVWDYMRRYFPINLVLSEEIRLQEANSSDNQLQPQQTQKQQQQQQQQKRQQSELSTTNGSGVITCNPALFPPDHNYLVGYHPHGIFGVGAFTNFGTEATGFSTKFPGLTPWLTTLEINFKAPFQRDMLQCFNIVVATYKGITYLLDPNQCGKRGNMVVVVLGGAHEALDSRPGKYVFHTKRRFGFFKLALMTGSALVPCVSFGEPNMYRQVQNPPGGWLRRWQDRFTDMATFSPPIFYARILAPYRTPVNTVVGPPIPVPLEPKPTRDQIANLKKFYLEKLNKLFQKYKPIYDPDADDVEFF
ncbi:2-acylglycerol O-acyltransferase 2-A [Fasciolopsis buskii]|uniref:Acyltransferase n=1 Tax=Fasciolopsis buskii TaxID=27845 RepID=A0A8E0RZ11_9TREM|nr:2-acylglycerol O-acyltransferase 2-A [Fasciolopsis buski]